MSKIQPRNLSATDRVEEHLRQAIYRGELKPRERIIEEDLAKLLHCSRGPVREALLRLGREGLVVTTARRGCFIQDLSPEAVEVIFSMRGKLEALCVRYLRQKLTREKEQALREALRKLRVATQQKNEEQIFQADMALHHTIWELSNRETLVRQLKRVMNPFMFVLARTYSNDEPRQRYKEHAEYVEMILTAAPSRVEHLVEQYFARLADSILAQIPMRLVGNSLALASPCARK